MECEALCPGRTEMAKGLQTLQKQVTTICSITKKNEGGGAEGAEKKQARSAEGGAQHGALSH